MIATDLMAKMLEDLYTGTPWLDVTFAATLQDVNVAQALQRPLAGGNNIWAITQHLIFWQQRMLRSLQGMPLKEDGDLPDLYIPENANEENWQATLQHLYRTYMELKNFIMNFPSEKLQETFKGNYSYFEFMQSAAQHAAYHLGQIIILKKYQ